MRSRIPLAFALTLILVLAEPRARAESPEGAYPQALQEKLQNLLRHQALEQMRHAVKRYNETVRTPAALSSATDTLKLSDVTLTELIRYFQTKNGPAPLAEWKNDEIRIQSGKDIILMSLDDYLESSIRVNGRTFAWNWGETASQNLARYEALWGTSQSFSLISEARADDVQVIKMAGLILYFQAASAQAKQPLESLRATLDGMIRSCQEGAMPIDGKDPMLRALTPIGDALNRHTFKNCKDIQDYAAQRGKSQGSPVNVPTDLCQKIDVLSACQRAPDPTAVSRKKPAKPVPPAKDEWHENPASGTSATPR